MFGWGKRPRATAVEQLQSGRWRCASCNDEHGWPFDLAAHAPDPWRGAQDHEPNSALRLDGDFLSEDLCILSGKYFMVRAVLPIPVQGVEEVFGFGCWSTLSRENFDNMSQGLTLAIILIGVRGAVGCAISWSIISATIHSLLGEATPRSPASAVMGDG